MYSISCLLNVVQILDLKCDSCLSLNSFRHQENGMNNLCLCKLLRFRDNPQTAYTLHNAIQLLRKSIQNNQELCVVYMQLLHPQTDCSLDFISMTTIKTSSFHLETLKGYDTQFLPSQNFSKFQPRILFFETIKQGEQFWVTLLPRAREISLSFAAPFKLSITLQLSNT